MDFASVFYFYDLPMLTLDHLAQLQRILSKTHTNMIIFIIPHFLYAVKPQIRFFTGIHFRVNSTVEFTLGIYVGFFWKTCPNRPADSLRCLPVTAVRPVLYLNLQSNYTKFLHFISFCFFRWRTAVSCFSSIDRFQLVCFAKVAACPPCIPLAKLSQLDRSRLWRRI